MEDTGGELSFASLAGNFRLCAPVLVGAGRRGVYLPSPPPCPVPRLEKLW